MRPLLLAIVFCFFTADVLAVPPEPNPNPAMRSRLIYGLLANNVDADGDIAPVSNAVANRYSKAIWDRYGLSGIRPALRAAYLDVDGNVVPWADLTPALKGRYFIGFVKHQIRQIRRGEVRDAASTAADEAAADAEQDTDLGADE